MKLPKNLLFGIDLPIFFYKNPKAFTLVELMVVIAIVAILAAVGFALFTGQQKNARDARRKADINALAKALEAAKSAGSASYPNISTSLFSNGLIPIDPTNTVSGTATTCPTVCSYCYTTSATPITTCAQSATFINSATVAPAGWTTPTTWTICANLEGGGSICRSNQQS